MKKLFIIAGEASGDILASDLIKTLKSRYPRLEIQGIGGQQSLEAGLEKSLFPMEELSLMGVVEIVPKLPKILKRIKQTVQAIETFKPDIILTIDSPDFSFRVQKQVRAKGLQAKQVHYVAPTVWAWREGRAKKISEFLDGILCLFPFEPPYFEKVGMKAVYTGHPVIQRYENSPTQKGARTTLGIAEESKVIGLLFGSRRGELNRHADIFLETIKRTIDENTRVLVPTLPHLKEAVTEKITEHFQSLDRFHITDDLSQQPTYFKAMDKALAVSGTVGLELAVARVPHVIGYRANALTVMIIKQMIKTEHAHLANIILNEALIPECIQENCNTDYLSEQLRDLDLKKQKEGFQRLEEIMKTEAPPSETIAMFLRSLL